MGITEDGTKRIIDLRQGATENAVVCTALLKDLQQRGLDRTQPMLLVLDGSKALHEAVRPVWGRNAVIQRCQIHKKRNVKAHEPEKHSPERSAGCRERLSLARISGAIDPLVDPCLPISMLSFHPLSFVNWLQLGSPVDLLPIVLFWSSLLEESM
jgi:transposase-like protein